MALCFCWETQSRPSADAGLDEVVPINPMESSDDEDFENVEFEEERYE